MKKLMLKLLLPGRNGSTDNEILPDMDDLVFYEVDMEKRDDDACLITGNLKHFPARSFIVTRTEMLAIISLRTETH